MRFEKVIIGDEKKTYIELSYDGKWVRIIVDGKMQVTFHVEYVKKMIGVKK